MTILVIGLVDRFEHSLEISGAEETIGTEKLAAQWPQYFEMLEAKYSDHMPDEEALKKIHLDLLYYKALQMEQGNVGYELPRENFWVKMLIEKGFQF